MIHIARQADARVPLPQLGWRPQPADLVSHSHISTDGWAAAPEVIVIVTSNGYSHAGQGADTLGGRRVWRTLPSDLFAP